uniref:Potassium voltage-gated channel subfamily E regulatory subunit 5 n=1 Tax=Chelonoidis abingdonii TaxID=106734 RepID=A0A8C0J514_CHEAB
ERTADTTKDTQASLHPDLKALRLRALLSHLLRHLPGGANASRRAAAPGGDDAYLYVLLIMIFYGCLAGGLILAYTRSRKLESKHDPFHLYIEVSL